jgi:hypothetical protein
MIFVAGSPTDERVCLLHYLEFDPVPFNPPGGEQLAELGTLAH